jgi:pimeloyl-ACP methyl ester carboxylesterase
MVLPISFSADGQAALEAVFKSCEADTKGCAKAYPHVRRQWGELLQGLPRRVTANHPLTGKAESFELTRAALLGLIRAPLYAPALASALPAAIDAAANGNLSALVGLSGSMGNRKSSRLAMGMHFSVVCAEDVPRMARAGRGVGEDLGLLDAQMYESACAFWPRGEVPSAFYDVPAAGSPVLVLSGGADPATPPRHGARIAMALGKNAQHIVVPEAGHGVMGIGCMRDVVNRFVVAGTDASALPQDAACATRVPRPPVFVPARMGAIDGAKP